LGGRHDADRDCGNIGGFGRHIFAVSGRSESASRAVRVTDRAGVAVTDVSAQRRVRRPSTRLRVYPRYELEPDGVYPRYYPGRNALRDCIATYVREYRPSGTVIVPRMNCYWRGG